MNSRILICTDGMCFDIIPESAAKISFESFLFDKVIDEPLEDGVYMELLNKFTGETKYIKSTVQLTEVSASPHKGDNIIIDVECIVKVCKFEGDLRRVSEIKKCKNIIYQLGKAHENFIKNSVSI